MGSGWRRRAVVWRVHGELDRDAYGPVQGDRESRGIWDKNSMYATEELWFEEHDMQGTPWNAPENYKKWAPMTYAAALGKFKTPTLVIGGERDYRVPYTQSAEFFSALQRRECRRSW